MNITSELEKLASLRDCGNLSQAEYEQAKALLLSGRGPETKPPTLPIQETGEESNKKRKTQLLCAVFSTLAAALSGVSAIIAPSLGSIGILIFWVGLSSFWWISHSKLKTERQGGEHQGR